MNNIIVFLIVVGAYLILTRIRLSDDGKSIGFYIGIVSMIAVFALYTFGDGLIAPGVYKSVFMGFALPMMVRLLIYGPKAQ